MKKHIITLLAIVLVTLSNLSAFQDNNLDIIDDGPETSSSSNLVTPNPVIIISVNDLNLEIRAKKIELRNAITSLRELLFDESDPAIRMELEYQIAILESELSDLQQINILTLEELQRSAIDQHLQTLTNIMKTLYDTLMRIIRNI